MTAPCPYGDWDKKKHQCTSLEINDNLIASCAKYEEISKDKSSKISPAFGAGCCMPLWNARREVIIRRDYRGVIPIQELR